MTLEELKRKEKELREKYGDDLYEKLYMQQYSREKATTAPPAAMTKPPAYPAAPKALNPLNLPEKIQPPKAPGKLGPGTSDNKIENTFYTSKANSGIMPSNLKSIQDFRGTIADLDKRIADLNKQQFNTMLSGDGKKTEAFDSLIKNTEIIRDSLKEQLARVMGIGSESTDKDMLRKGGGNETKPYPSSRLQFNPDEPRQVKGLDDEEKPEPLKNPTEKAEEDFDDYLDRDDYNSQDDYLKAVAEHLKKYIDYGDEEGFKNFVKENNLNNPLARESWEYITKLINMKSRGHIITATPDNNDPTEQDNVYVTAENFNKLYNKLKDELDRSNMDSTNASYNAIGNIKGRIDRLKKNRRWSVEQESLRRLIVILMNTIRTWLSVQ